MHTIEISTKEQLNIYMNPQRQRLLKYMELEGKPMTPKQLADLLQISPSSVTHHLKKLLELGVVELDHTEMIRGICARFYRRVPVIVNLRGGKKDDLRTEKEAFLDYLMNDIWSGFREYLRTEEVGQKTTAHRHDDMAMERGDMLNGVAYLTPEAVIELKTFWAVFQEKYSTPGDNAKPWELALIAYPREVN